jgi:hypothetical protein
VERPLGKPRQGLPFDRQAKPSALGAGVITTTAEITTTGAATAGTTSIEAVTAPITAAIAAILPTAGSGTTLAAITPSPGGSTAIAATATSAATGAIAAAAITAAAGTTTSTARGAGFGLVDAQRTTHQLNPLQRIDGLRLKLGIHHLHEGETTLATGVPLEGEGAVRHLSKASEKLENVFLLSAEGKIADKNTH